MAIQNFEMWQGLSGDQDRRTVRYLVTGAATDIEALDHLEQDGAAPDGTPFFYDGMSRENISINEISAKQQLWYGDAHYTRRSGNKPAPDRNTTVNQVTTPGQEDEPELADKDSYSFDISVNNVRETRVDSVKSITATPNPGQYVGGAAGFRDDNNRYTLLTLPGLGYEMDYGYRGLDVLRPSGSFTLDIYPEDSKVTRAYQRLVMESVGKVNSVAFRYHEPGEVLFYSARGSARNRADWQFSFTFQVRKNRTNIDLGNGVEIPTLQGWDHVDPIWEQRVTNPDSVEPYIEQVCRQVSVWRIYEQMDFGSLLI